MIFKGTDTKAFAKAGKEKTPQARSARYQREKRKNEIKGAIKDGLSSLFSGSSNVSNRRKNAPGSKAVDKRTERKLAEHKNRKQQKIKNTVLDYVRSERSPKLISDFSDGVAKFLLGLTSEQLTNRQYNYLRSTISLVTSEVLSGLLKEEIKMINNLKTYIKVGKYIYEVGLIINEKLGKVEFDKAQIRTVNAQDEHYRAFLKKHSQIQKYYIKNDFTECLSKAEIEQGIKCPRAVWLSRQRDISKNFDSPNGCPYYNYCIGEK
jgi:hypothetical protein